MTTSPPVRWLPLLLLVLMAVTIDEFITGGTPVTPGSLALFFLLPVVPAIEGLGVVLAREAAGRWRQGWGAVFLIGGGMGLLEQGFMTKVIFGPSSSPVIGFLGRYGRFLGVNWVLFVLAFVFTGLFVTAFSVWFVDRLFPGWTRQPMLSALELGIVAFVFSVAVVVAWLVIPWNQNLPLQVLTYSPGVLDSTLIVGSFVLLVLAAWKVPRDLLRPTTPTPRFGVATLGVLSLGFSLGLELLSGPVTNHVPWAAVTVAAVLGLSVAALLFVRESIGRGENSRHQVAIVAGALLPYLAIDFFLELGGDLGVLVVSALVVVLLVYLYRRSPV